MSNILSEVYSLKLDQKFNVSQNSLQYYFSALSSTGKGPFCDSQNMCIPALSQGLTGNSYLDFCVSLYVQLPSFWYSVLQVPASLEAWNSNLCLLNSSRALHLLKSNSHYHGRRMMQAETQDNHGAYLVCFYSLKDHRSSLLVAQCLHHILILLHIFC